MRLASQSSKQHGEDECATFFTDHGREAGIRRLTPAAGLGGELVNGPSGSLDPVETGKCDRHEIHSEVAKPRPHHPLVIQYAFKITGYRLDIDERFV